MTAAQELPFLPAWLREVDIALAANPQILISGNLRDYILLPRPKPAPAQLADVVEAVHTVLRTAGHTALLAFDPVDGARVLMDDAPRTAATILRSAQSGDGVLGVLSVLLREVVGADRPCCLIIDGASRLVPDADFSVAEMHRVLIIAEKLMNTARRHPVAGPHRTQLYNTVFWLVDQENDLPHWLIGAEAARVVSIPAPGLGQRREAISTLVSSLPEVPERGTPAREALIDRYARQTSGLTLRSIREINRLAIDRRIAAADIEDAIRMFRVGVPDNPWQDMALKERIRRGTELLGVKVLGQPAAIRKSVDILIRSSMGLTGAHSASSGARPQGVLFFAGPSGVGKTELAKSIAELVFGRAEAFLRFDMSEFSAEQAEARLIGAPPGYIGHNSGGELTNAVRQQPFQLILFDEIEKAHPRILDKFLQILEDGRLTDGNGSTVFFSETLLVFTSNLGVYRTDERGRRVPVVARGSPYPVVESTIRAAVADHFVKEIGRPEILNRIGDNVVVFDFISAEIAARLVPMFVRNVTDRVRAHTGVSVILAEKVQRTLLDVALTRLDFGGRGVAATVESLLVNPLARALFDLAPAVTDVLVSALEESEEGWSVLLG